MLSEHVQALTTFTYKRRVNDQVKKLNPDQVNPDKQDLLEVFPLLNPTRLCKGGKQLNVNHEKA